MRKAERFVGAAFILVSGFLCPPQTYSQSCSYRAEEIVYKSSEPGYECAGAVLSENGMVVGQCYSGYYLKNLLDRIKYGSGASFVKQIHQISVEANGEGFWYQNGSTAKLTAVDDCRRDPAGRGTCKILGLDSLGGFWLHNGWQFLRGNIEGAYELTAPNGFCGFETLVNDDGVLSCLVDGAFLERTVTPDGDFVIGPDETRRLFPSGDRTQSVGPGGLPVRNWRFDTGNRPKYNSYDVNETGTTVGSVTHIINGSPINHPYVFKDGKVRILKQKFNKHSKAFAVNNRGVVGGFVSDIAWRARPAIWKGKRLIELKLPHKDYKSVKSTRPIGTVIGVNDRNEYLVRAGTFSKNPRKTGGFFVYRGSSICVPYEGLLSKFGKNDLAYPAGINNKGQVLMLAYMGKKVRTFLLSPKG